MLIFIIMHPCVKGFFPLESKGNVTNHVATPTTVFKSLHFEQMLPLNVKTNTESSAC